MLCSTHLWVTVSHWLKTYIHDEIFENQFSSPTLIKKIKKVEKQNKEIKDPQLNNSPTLLTSSQNIFLYKNKVKILN